MTLNENLNHPDTIAAMIDHTLLKPEATREDVARLCAEAREFEFASVCINPCWVTFAAQALAGSSVRVCTVIAFPLGANETRTKIAEAKYALSDGSQEIDMVQNVGALRSGDFELVRKEIAELADAAHASAAILKVILETCLLTDEQKATSCQLAMQAGADFVKTSTGFSTSGATIDDVKLMRRIVGDSMGVKASGGIRSFPALRDMVAAGANRIGTSSGVGILREARTHALDTNAVGAPGKTSSLDERGGLSQAKIQY